MTEQDIWREAEDRFLFPSVEHDNHDRAYGFVEGAKFMAYKIEKWLNEHLTKDTSVLSSGIVSVGFDGLMDNFRNEFIEE